MKVEQIFQNQDWLPQAVWLVIYAKQRVNWVTLSERSLKNISDAAYPITEEYLLALDSICYQTSLR